MLDDVAALHHRRHAIFVVHEEFRCHATAALANHSGCLYYMLNELQMPAVTEFAAGHAACLRHAACTCFGIDDYATIAGKPKS